MLTRWLASIAAWILPATSNRPGMSFPSTRQVRRIVKPVWFFAGLLPLVWFLLLAFDIAAEGLGADPIEATQNYMGSWAMRILLVTLALTPLRRLTGWLWLIRLRRMTGLFALFYATLHLLNYLLLDQSLRWSDIVEDILITVGATAFLGLATLGLTSTSRWQKRLGRNWQKLHRLIYPAAILVMWHFWWQFKSFSAEPLIHVAILAVLLSARMVQKKTAPG